MLRHFKIQNDVTITLLKKIYAELASKSYEDVDEEIDALLRARKTARAAQRQEEGEPMGEQ
jgi:hypothetical protein